MLFLLPAPHQIVCLCCRVSDTEPLLSFTQPSATVVCLPARVGANLWTVSLCWFFCWDWVHAPLGTTAVRWAHNLKCIYFKKTRLAPGKHNKKFLEEKIIRASLLQKACVIFRVNSFLLIFHDKLIFMEMYPFEELPLICGFALSKHRKQKVLFPITTSLESIGETAPLYTRRK